MENLTRSYEHLAAQFPPGTVNDERNRVRDELSALKVLVKSWMNSQKLPCHHFGPYSAQHLRVGGDVVIRRGVLVKSTNPKFPVGGRPLLRTSRVRVHSMSDGYIDFSNLRGRDDAPIHDPVVRWVGAGGYWNWTCANNVSTGDLEPRQEVGRMSVKLSEAQRRVLRWLGNGWQASPGGGSALVVNGARICNTDTMMALQRVGLVKRDDQGCWKATAKGAYMASALGL